METALSFEKVMTTREAVENGRIVAGGFNSKLEFDSRIC